MRSSYPLITLLVLALNFSFAQEWERQHPDVNLSQLEAIYMGADGYGWAVGQKGTILHTDNFGESWTEQTQNHNETGQAFLAVVYDESSQGQTAYAGANGGRLILTTTGGQSWQRADFGEQSPFGAIQDIVIPAAGQAAFSTLRQIWHSADSGDSWQLAIEFAEQLESLTFGSAATGWAGLENGHIYQTADGGQSWQPQDTISFTTPISLSFINEDVGFAETDKNVYKTTDGGQSWELLAENAFPLHLWDFQAANEEYLYGVAGNRIYYSQDGGTTWGFGLGTSYPYRYEGVYALPDGRVWAAGTFGTILTNDTENGDWSDQNPANKNWLQFIRFYDGQTGLAGGGAQALLKTTNGGQQWADISFPGSSSNNFYDAWMASENEYLLSGRDTIYRTTDGGQSWTAVSTGTGPHFYRFFEAPDGALYVGNQNGNIYRSQDNGLSWQEVPTGAQTNIYDGYFTSPSTGYVCGRNGLILKTSDAGISWDTLNTGTTHTISDVEFTSETTGWGVLNINRDTILYTDDGGQSWTSRPLPVSTFWEQVHFSDEQTGWLVGGSAAAGVILQTKDGGQSWERALTNGFSIKSIALIESEEGRYIWAAGRGGVIEYFSDAVINSLAESKAVAHPLSVFPNPTDGRVVLDAPGGLSAGAQLTVFDSNGRALRQEPLRGRTELQLDLPAGLYLLNVHDPENGRAYRSRLVISPR